MSIEQDLHDTLSNMTASAGFPFLSRVEIVSELGSRPRQRNSAAIYSEAGGCCGVFVYSLPGSDHAAALRLAIVERINNQTKYTADPGNEGGPILVSDPTYSPTPGEPIKEPSDGTTKKATRTCRKNRDNSGNGGKFDGD